MPPSSLSGGSRNPQARRIWSVAQTIARSEDNACLADEAGNVISEHTQTWSAHEELYVVGEGHAIFGQSYTATLPAPLRSPSAP